MTIATDISRRPLLPLLLALSGAHLLNDLIASMIPAMYPLFKEAYQLDFTQIGLITLAFHVTVVAAAAGRSATSPTTSRGPMRWSRAWPRL